MLCVLWLIFMAGLLACWGVTQTDTQFWWDVLKSLGIFAAIIVTTGAVYFLTEARK